MKRHQTLLGKQELLYLLLFGWTRGPQGLRSLLGVTGWRLQPTLLLPFICQHEAEEFWGFFSKGSHASAGTSNIRVRGGEFVTLLTRLS